MVVQRERERESERGEHKINKKLRKQKSGERQ
jgi:hypothetical protein